MLSILSVEGLQRRVSLSKDWVPPTALHIQVSFVSGRSHAHGLNEDCSLSQCPWPWFLGMVLNSSLSLFFFLLSACLRPSHRILRSGRPGTKQLLEYQPQEAQVQQESSEAEWQQQGFTWKC